MNYCSEKRANSLKNCNIKVTYYVDGAFAKCENKLTLIFQYSQNCYVYCFKQLQNCGKSVQLQIHVSIDTKKSVFNKSFDDQFNCRYAKSRRLQLKASNRIYSSPCLIGKLFMLFLNGIYCQYLTSNSKLWTKFLHFQAYKGNVPLFNLH